MNYIIYIYDFIIIYIMSLFGIIYNPNPNTNTNIYISFTTIPSRSKNIIFTINSILKQTIIPNKIFITISKNNFREQNINYEIPEAIQNHKLIEIIILEKDNGPINKLYGGLLNCNEDEDIIITVDDDSIYNRYMIETIYNYSKTNNTNVIGTIGRINYESKIFGYNYDKPINVKLLEGYGGIGYRKKFLNLEDINTNGLNEEIILNDDIYISYILSKKNIELIMIPSKIKEPITHSIFTEKTNPLWKCNENGVFNKCLKTLKLN